MYIHVSKRWLALFCSMFATLLTACGPMQIRDARTATWVPIQAGSLEVHRDIRIPGGRARIFFQDGVLSSGINEFKPFCWLEVATLEAQDQSVHPDSFTIIQVSGGTEEIVESGPLMLAALHGVAMTALDSDNGGPSRITRLLNFSLHSNLQPDVRRLTCGGAFEEPSDADAPTVQEIAVVLGEYAALMLR